MNKRVLTYFKEYSAIFNLVSCSVNNTQMENIDENLNWRFIFTESRRLGMLTLVYDAVQRLPDQYRPEQQIMSAFSKENSRLIIVDTNQLIELQKLESAFEENGIDMLLLKGVYLKQMYKSTYYRYMGDIDTFVKLEDFKRANPVLEKLGYVLENDTGKDWEYFKKPYIFLEQHHSIVEKEMHTVNEYYKGIWQRCILKKGASHIYTMPLEDIYIYLIVHAVHHFEYSGIAPRIFLDFYVFTEHNKGNLDKGYVDKILAEFGYLEFSKKVLEVAYRWFSKNGSGIDKDNELDLFIAGCGDFGTIENNVGIRSANMTESGKKPSKVRFILKQAFPHTEVIAQEFPVLKKAPILLPFIWAAYVMKKAVKSPTVNYYKTINSETVNYYKNIIRELGLENRKDK